MGNSYNQMSSPKKIKARRMYAPVNKSGTIGYWASLKDNVEDIAHVPVAVLDVSDPDALVESFARSMYDAFFADVVKALGGDDITPEMRNDARKVLEQHGIIPKQRKTK